MADNGGNLVWSFEALKDYLDQRFRDVEDKAVLRAQTVANQLRAEIIGKETFNAFVSHNDADLLQMRMELKEYKEPKYALWISFIGVFLLVVGGLYGLVIKPLQAQLESAQKAIMDQSRNSNSDRDQLNGLGSLLKQHMEEKGQR